MDTSRRAILICGLPASGKTTLALGIVSSNPDAILIDDPTDWMDVNERIASHKGLVILTDPHLCFISSREVAQQRFEELGFRIEWLFFENNPKQCIVNAKGRAKEVNLDISWFSKSYSIPLGVVSIPVYSGITSC